MPDVERGEPYDDFMARCIPIVKGEDKGQGYDPKHAAAKCNGIWEQSKKRSQVRESLDEGE